MLIFLEILWSTSIIVTCNLPFFFTRGYWQHWNWHGKTASICNICSVFWRVVGNHKKSWKNLFLRRHCLISPVDGALTDSWKDNLINMLLWPNQKNCNDCNTALKKNNGWINYHSSWPKTVGSRGLVIFSS